MPAANQISDYNREQLEALRAVRACLADLSEAERRKLGDRLTDYLAFRTDLDAFLKQHFSGICSHTCYTSRLSACCSKEGIITFFADVVINALQTTDEQLDQIQQQLQRSQNREKCVYLTPGGCRWQVRPIVCAMFLCSRAASTVFGDHPALERMWKDLCRRRKSFTWPDRPVLFDDLEAFFIKRGCTSPLMYLHNSPGLLRVKQTSRKAKS